MTNAMSSTDPAPDRTERILLERATNGKLELDPAFCWQGVSSHDRRFDGRFFAGIDSTGVYCRSICPVSFGRPANVRWFPSAMAAEAAGFRPCKRCRPDTSPGSSAWSGTLAVVSKALKLISEGALDHGNLEQLAERVGIGSRHLRRLFNQHLGTSPLKIARSHRLKSARNLILETKAGITEIASRTGFGSIRQLNHSVLTTFGRSPTQLRLQQGVTSRIVRESGIVVHLPYRAPFDWSSMIEFLKARAIPGVEAVEDDCYRRTIEIGEIVGAIEVWHEADHARLAMRVILPSCDRLMQVVQRVRRMFDLETDVVRIGQHLSQDARLAKMLAVRPGLRVPGGWDGYELAVRAVLGQMLTVVDAPALARRLVRTFGRPVQISVRGLTHLFPQPGILAEANLTSVGISGDQAATISSLSHAMVTGKLDFNSEKGMQGTLARLCAYTGLNQGVASYIAMRSFGEPDALPHTDHGLRKALATHAKPLSPAELLNTFKGFKPWRAYAAMHFAAAMQKAGRPTRSTD
jgi:AraC family transcriptional regulator, regulatory protein of adaptative response / DNA-3-methyladenine glycosylase II